MTADHDNNYLYDGDGRVCAVNNGLGMTQYIYDAEGSRVAKGTISAWSCDTTVNGFQVTNSYVLGLGGEQVTEMNITAGQPTWAHTNVYAGGMLVATYDPLGLHFQLTDWLGNRRVQTNAFGQVEETWSNAPFGNYLTPSYPSGAPPTADDATEHHFTGKERDAESGLDYFGARYYGSNMGRFMSPDWNEAPSPIPYGNLGDPQTLNLYAYVGNNPLSRNDPTGHFAQDQKLTNQSTIRVDTASADQVNVHVKTNNGEFRGRLNPDTKQIEWTKGAPSKQIAEAAQEYVLSKGKYDIAAAKKEMSVLGGTREGEEGIGGKLGESANAALAIMNIIDIFAQAAQMAKINSLEGTTGFHLQIDGSIAVTNLQKFGDTFGVGAGVKYNGDTFRLNDSGNWVDRSGNTLTQDQKGNWHVQGAMV